MRREPIEPPRWARPLAAAFMAALGLPLALRWIEWVPGLDLFNTIVLHEPGHLLFLPFGQTLHFLGGTLTQLALPTAAALALWRAGDAIGPWACLFWTGQNLLNVARYVADARAQALPIAFGGGIHDWNWLLGRWGWLEHDQALGGVLFGLGTLIMAISTGGVLLRTQDWPPLRRKISTRLRKWILDSS